MERALQPTRAPRPRVVVLSRQGRAGLAPHGLDRLERAADVTFLELDGPATIGQTRAVAADADVMAVTPLVSPAWTGALLDELTSLQLVALHATGYDFVDIALFDDHGVCLAPLPDYSTRSVAEHTVGLLLALSTRLHLANDRSRGRAPSSVSLRGFELAGRRLGVIGLGRIGSEVARLGTALGMDVISCDRSGRSLTGVTPVVDLGQLLDVADAVAVTASRDHDGPPLIGWDELARLRPGSVVVNTSRAGLVDHDAIAVALRSRRLRGYAVDDAVFDPVADADLIDEGRVIQTGHSAWWSDEALDRGTASWVQLLIELVEGRAVEVVGPPINGCDARGALDALTGLGGRRAPGREATAGAPGTPSEPLSSPARRGASSVAPARSA